MDLTNNSNTGIATLSLTTSALDKKRDKTKRSSKNLLDRASSPVTHRRRRDTSSTKSPTAKHYSLVPSIIRGRKDSKEAEARATENLSPSKDPLEMPKGRSTDNYLMDHVPRKNSTCSLESTNSSENHSLDENNNNEEVQEEYFPEQKKSGELIKYRENDSSNIWLATCESLIRKLADNDYQDKNYIETFLLTYEYFMDSMKFLNMLISHYRVLKIHSEDNKIDDNTRTFIQLRVINVIKKWLEVKFVVLQGNKEWCVNLKSFINTLKKNGTSNEKSWAKHLKKSMGNCVQPVNPSLNILSLPRNKLATLNECTIPIQQLADQMTLLDHCLFRSVRLESYYNKAWEKSDIGKQDAGIHKIINNFNEVSSWVVTEIVMLPQNRKQRVNKIVWFIRLMELLLNYQNYNGVMKIYSALNTAPVTRLKKAWKDVPSKFMNMYNNTHKVFGETNFRNYRDLLDQISPPAVPYQGLILADLTFIEESPNFETDGPSQFVNWEKMRLLSKIFTGILKFQKSCYDIKPDPNLIDFFMYLPEYRGTYTADEQHVKSLSIEKEEKEDRDLISSSENYSLSASSSPTRSHDLRKKTWKRKRTEKTDRFKPVQSFDSLFTNQSLFEEFQRYLASLFSDENLLFYREVSEFRNMDFSDVGLVIQKATRIFETYVTEQFHSLMQKLLRTWKIFLEIIDTRS